MEHRPVVLVADSISASELTPLSAAGIEVLDRSGISAADLALEIGRCDGLLVRSRTKVDAALLARATRLRVVGRAGTGVDNVDLVAATRAGIVVMNVPSGNTNAAAEHTIALLMALARHVADGASALRKGQFEQKPFIGIEVEGRTLGVIGLGRIGRAVASKARGLGMRVSGFDPMLDASAIREMGIEPADLGTLAANSDVVTVHVPLAEKTRHLVNAEFIARMKRGARILNVARGGIVDEKALLDALESGQLAGAALDVFEQEPPTNTALLQHPRLLSTPHLGASTMEAQSAVARLIAGQVARFLTSGAVENAVNLTGLGAEERAQLTPWMELARRLGVIAAGLIHGRPESAELLRCGEGILQRGDVLAAESVVGLLTPWMGQSLNPVNARVLAAEWGFSLVDRSLPGHRSFPGLLRLAVKAGAEELALDGTLFGHGMLRIVRAYGMNIDAIPEGHMLFVRHRDRPGMIAAMGAILAAEDLNIANMSVGRDVARGHALSILNCDEAPSVEALAAIGRLEGVESVRAVVAPPAA
jgi:D-3-phosphoglycerate dehydrogenase